MKRFLSSPIFHLIFLAVLVAGIYANSIGGDFVFDDKSMILTYDLVKDIGNIPKAFISPTSLYGNTNYYRPIQTVTNITDYFLWGRAAFGFHITNILFHLMAVLLLYWFINIIYGKNMLAFLTAVLFAAHPVNTSVVSYISGRADSMLLCFMLLSFIFYIKAVYKSSGRVCFSISVFFFALCLFTKEFALIIPFSYVFFDLYLSGYTPLGRNKKDIKRYLPFLVLVVLYLVFRFARMSFFVEGAIKPFPFYQRLITVPYWVGQYLRMIFLPNDLHIGRIPWVAASALDPRVLTSFIAVAALIIGLFRLRKKFNVVWFGLCWFCIMLIPALNIITPLFYTLAENWLYIASIGIYTAIAALVIAPPWSGRRGIVKYGAVMAYTVFIAALACLTVRQNSVWKDEVSLGVNTLKFNPFEFKVWNNIGVVYLGRKDLDKAEEAFNKCLEIKPDTGMAYFNLYRVNMLRGKRELALKQLEMAKQLDPKMVGIVIQKMGIRD